MDYKPQSGYDMLYFAACAIGGVTPAADRVKGADLEEVYRLSSMQKLGATVFCALEKVEGLIEDRQLYEKWREDRNKAIRKNLLLDAERGQLFNFLESRGIWYMPLKGVILKDYYPAAGMREMSDNDILFDKAYAEEVKEWFVGRGYECEVFGAGAHDSYIKEPVFCFEMHRMLFTFDSTSGLTSYYQNVKERLNQTSGSFGYSFGKEDYYLYIVSHAYKHSINGGTGLRTLLDFYVYLKAEELDMGYIAAEAQKLGVEGFEEGARKLALKIFTPPFSEDITALSEEEREKLNAFLFSGAYGSLDNFVADRVKDGEGNITARSKRRYLWRRLFPRKDMMLAWCEIFMPSAARHKCLLPLAYIWRIIRNCIFRPARAKSELKAMRKIEKKKKVKNK